MDSIQPRLQQIKARSIIHNAEPTTHIAIKKKRKKSLFCFDKPPSLCSNKNKDEKKIASPAYKCLVGNKHLHIQIGLIDQNAMRELVLLFLLPSP